MSIQREIDELAASRGLSTDEVLTWLADSLGRTGATSPAPESDWSVAELDVLTRAGIDVSPAPDDRPAGDYLDLLASGLSVHQAADRIGVNTSRVRQLLSERKLYGIKPHGRAWVLPAWQFTRTGLVPGLDVVLPSLGWSERTHPLTVTGWFTTPKPELVVGDEAASPLTWLLSGGSPDAVADLSVDAFAIS